MALEAKVVDSARRLVARMTGNQPPVTRHAGGIGFEKSAAWQTDVGRMRPVRSAQNHPWGMAIGVTQIGDDTG
jgi:hypothetical protein